MKAVVIKTKKNVDVVPYIIDKQVVGYVLANDYKVAYNVDELEVKEYYGG